MHPLNDASNFRPVVLPDWLWDTLTPEQRASGYYVRLEPLPEPPDDRPVRWTNRAARRHPGKIASAPR